MYIQEKFFFSKLSFTSVPSLCNYRLLQQIPEPAPAASLESPSWTILTDHTSASSDSLAEHAHQLAQPPLLCNDQQPSFFGFPMNGVPMSAESSQREQQLHTQYPAIQ